jgi:hypothetical protein
VVWQGATMTCLGATFFLCSLFSMLGTTVTSTVGQDNPCVSTYEEVPAGKTLFPQIDQSYVVPETDDIVWQILRSTGHFRIPTYAVPDLANACAAAPQGNAAIFYDPVWLDAKSGTEYWVRVGILAHELGHIVNRHDLRDKLGFWRKEYEADYFVGSAVAALHGTIDDALKAVSLQPVDATEDYPPRALRMAAVTDGYKAVVGDAPVEQPTPAVEITKLVEDIDRTAFSGGPSEPNPGCQNHDTESCITPQNGGGFVAGSAHFVVRSLSDSSMVRTSFALTEDGPNRICYMLHAQTGACETRYEITGHASGLESFLQSPP